MKTLFVTVNVVLISMCLEASPMRDGTIPIVPVFRQPYGGGDDSRIVKGKEATLGQFPYQAAIRIDNSNFCGGSLISKNWVLTAAHCIHNFQSWTVTLGAHNIENDNEQGRVVVATTKAIHHENYTRINIQNDIGVVSLPKDVALNNRINIIKLPPLSYQNIKFAGKTVRVSGWGKTSDNAEGISPTLQYVDLKVITNDECASYYASITKTKYCCSGEDHMGTCNGDSGGSLTIANGKNVTHLGIVSFVSADGCQVGSPSGYTATPYFVEWILEKTGIPIHEEGDYE